MKDLKIKVKNVLNSEHQKDVEGWLEANKVLFLYFGTDLIADASDETIREEFEAWLAVGADYDYDYNRFSIVNEFSDETTFLKVIKPENAELIFVNAYEGLEDELIEEYGRRDPVIHQLNDLFYMVDHLEDKVYRYYNTEEEQ